MMTEDTYIKKMLDVGGGIIRGDACIVVLVGMPNASTSKKIMEAKE